MSRYPIRASGGCDTVLWKHSENVYKDHFSATKGWECIRASNPKVHWYRLVWFAQGISCHAFIVWLSLQDRLSTGSQLRSWGIMQSCVFFFWGGEGNESRTFVLCLSLHFYYLVDTGRQATWCIVNSDWTVTILSLLRLYSLGLDTVLKSMNLHTTLYMLWRERNSRRYQGACLDTKTLINTIEKSIHNRIVSHNYRQDHKLEGFLRRWFKVFTGWLAENDAENSFNFFLEMP